MVLEPCLRTYDFSLIIYYAIIFVVEERLESLYIRKNVLHVQGEDLYKLSYTNLKKENIQFPYTYNLTSSLKLIVV